MISPKGSETTGGIFDKFGNYIVNIQHPDYLNKSRFNRSSLIVVKGIQD
jgi:secreted PhoX family phosphatase